jgi:spermidine synthase
LTAHHRVVALFVLSGASGLVFEVIWVRQLALWVGHGTVAVSLVVSAFLAGLVLGSWLGGRLADRGGRLVRTYAVLEACTGLTALFVSVVLSRSAMLSSWIADHGPPLASGLAVRTCVGFVVVFAPTATMGATLPVLTRHLSKTRDLVGAPLAALYALNTLGAALGCALAGFALLGSLGMLRTALIASGANFLVAAMAWSLDPMVTPPETSIDSGLHVGSSNSRSARPSLTLIACATGFSAIACEVLWFRVLHAFVKSSTYAFTLLLVTYLVGLVVGGIVYARRLAAHPRPWELLSDVQSALAAMTLVSVALLGRASSIAGALSRHAASGDDDLVHLALGAAVIFAPATLMGASFPLVASLGARDGRNVGSSVGALAAANTLGGALGSLITGLILIPTLGTLSSFSIAALLTVGSSLLARREASGSVPLRGAAGRTARLALLVVLVLALVPREYLVKAVTTFPRARVLDAREGRDGTAAVLGYDRDRVCSASRNRCATRCSRDFSYQQLLFGTVSYASTIPPAKRYMRALAHLPMLVHRGARPLDVTEVCFGTGTTAGAFTAHASLASLTIVDINRDVFDFARHFSASNHNVLDDLRVRRVVEDGRHHLATAAGAWDVVSLEPPPPTAEGAASLYTREFYVAARRRLRPGGVIAQWIPLDQQTEDLDRAMLAAVASEFREVEVYIPSREEGVVLASDASLVPDLAQWRARWSADVAESLADVGFSSPESLAATRVLDTEGVRAWLRGRAPMTDDLPSVEFYRAYPGTPFRVSSMLALPPRASIVGSDATRAALRRFERIERLGMNAWERSIAGDLAGASSIVAEMRREDPEGVYTRYLAELEYDCLNLSDP